MTGLRKNQTPETQGRDLVAFFADEFVGDFVKR